MASRIVDVTEEAAFGLVPACADPGFDHRTCDYWEDEVRGSKAARLAPRREGVVGWPVVIVVAERVRGGAGRPRPRIERVESRTRGRRERVAREPVRRG